MSYSDFQSSDDQQGGVAPREVREEFPGLLSRIIHVASGLAQHVRETPSLRMEVIQILRHIERAVTPSEPSKPESTPAESSQEVDGSEAGTDQVPAPKPAQEPVQESETQASRATVDDSTLRDLETAIASVSAFGGTEAMTRVTRTSVGLDAIARSCRVKAEACVWAVERKNLLADGVDFRMEIVPRDRSLIEKARALEDCFLWMTTATAPMPEPVELYSELADRYEDAADVADSLAELMQQNDEQEALESAMLLGAEAQSALRAAVSEIGFRGVDSCQIALFQWVLQAAQERNLFIHRYMQIADKPGRSEILSLSGRIADLQKLHRLHTAAKKFIANALKKISYHLNLISSVRDNTYDWGKIFATVTDLVPKYLRVSDVQLRELLVRYVDEIPEEIVVPPAGQDVLDAIDEFLANRPELAPVEKTKILPSPEAAALKANLKGKTVVIIGGASRPYAKEALRDAFDLQEVVWISTRAHESPEYFLPSIRASGVAVVLLAIRWSSHCYGVVREYCKDANVPFVRLPAGYNPSQVAHQIISQVPAIATA